MAGFLRGYAIYPINPTTNQNQLKAIFVTFVGLQFRQDYNLDRTAGPQHIEIVYASEVKK